MRRLWRWSCSRLLRKKQNLACSLTTSINLLRGKSLSTWWCCVRHRRCLTSSSAAMCASSGILACRGTSNQNDDFSNFYYWLPALRFCIEKVLYYGRVNKIGGVNQFVMHALSYELRRISLCNCRQKREDGSIYLGIEHVGPIAVYGVVSSLHLLSILLRFVDWFDHNFNVLEEDALHILS